MSNDSFTSISGEKVVPLQQEALITSSAMVSGVIVFGRGRGQCGVLIEPRPDYAIQDPSDEAAVIKFRNLIWCVSRLRNSSLSYYLVLEYIKGDSFISWCYLQGHYADDY